MNTAFVQADMAPQREMRDTELTGPAEMTSLHIESTISYRYAKTIVTSRLVNSSEKAREISFNAILPQSAFISAFQIELDGNTYDAYVKEKEEAKTEYTEAVSQGRTAAIVDLTARDSNRFNVSVNVEARAKVTFKLTYEELLTRRLSVYSNVINIDPGQIVPALSVVIHIEESNNLTILRVPSLRVTNELEQEASSTNDPLAVIERPAPNKATIRWSPSVKQQRELKEDGVKGQLTVDYDVERKDNASQILVSDGYFVHFYSPEDLAPLNKHVVFVLDMSGSMCGTKLQQLQEAMRTILSDLREGDYFSIALFAFTVQVWRPSQVAVEVNIQSETELSPELIVKVTPDNIRLAKEFVDNLNANGGTNINDALMTSLDIIRVGQKMFDSVKPQQTSGQVPTPMVIFLTDGQANVGQSDTEMIVKGVTQKNTRQAAIFSLSFGRDADKDFLKKLSLKNSGFSRLIYEASDAALQLRDFYRQIASPLLANVAFSYDPKQVNNETLTNLNFSTMFRGSELVVAGKLTDDTAQLTGALNAMSMTGECRCIFPPPLIIRRPVEQDKTIFSFMEKLWAYLNIQQLLDKQELVDDGNTKSKDQALAMALKYSFVTPLTSLVVVKPNETSRVDAEDAGVPLPQSQQCQQSFAACPPMAGAPMMMQSRMMCDPNAGGNIMSSPMPFAAPMAMSKQSFGCALPGVMKKKMVCERRTPQSVPVMAVQQSEMFAPLNCDMDIEEDSVQGMGASIGDVLFDDDESSNEMIVTLLAALAPSVTETLWKVSNASGSLALSMIGEKSLNLNELSGPFVWFGKTATTEKKVKVVKEGQKFLVNHEYPAVQGKARLFHCRFKINGKIEEIQQYQQINLDDEDIMVLDAGEQIFIWIGSKMTDEEKTRSFAMAQKYLESHTGADTKDIALIFFVKKGEEPVSFISMFPSWNAY